MRNVWETNQEKSQRGMRKTRPKVHVKDSLQLDGLNCERNKPNGESHKFGRIRRRKILDSCVQIQCAPSKKTWKQVFEWPHVGKGNVNTSFLKVYLTKIENVMLQM